MKKQKPFDKERIEELEKNVEIQQEEIKKLNKKMKFQKWMNLFLIWDD